MEFSFPETGDDTEPSTLTQFVWNTVEFALLIFAAVATVLLGLALVFFSYWLARSAWGLL